MWTKTALAGLLALATLAHAQSTMDGTHLAGTRAQALDGKWLAEWNSGGRGALVAAVLELKDGVGSYRNVIRISEHEKNCRKVVSPVEVREKPGMEGFGVVIQHEKALMGCGMSVMLVSPQADGSLSARWWSGHSVKLTRQ